MAIDYEQELREVEQVVGRVVLGSQDPDDLITYSEALYDRDKGLREAIREVAKSGATRTGYRHFLEYDDFAFEQIGLW